MEFISATPESELYALSLYKLLGSVSCLVLFTVSILNKKSLFNATVKTTFLAAFFMFLSYCVAERFHTMTIVNTHISFNFIWSVLDETIEKDDISAVTFGIRGKGKHCYISVNTHSGDKYQSVTLAKDTDICKTTRTALIERLGL